MHGIIYVDIINHINNSALVFMKQINLQETSYAQTLCTLKTSTDVKISTFWKQNGGMGMQITKWFFKAISQDLIISAPYICSLPNNIFIICDIIMQN